MSAATGATSPIVQPRRLRRGGPRYLPVYFGAILVLLYLPIAILFIFSLQTNTTLSFPLGSLTLDWYAKLGQSDALLRSARNSVVVALASSLAATILGTMIALIVVRHRFRSRNLLIALAALPLIVPFIVLAVALLILFRALSIELSLATVGIAHTIVALPYVLLIVGARLIGFERNLEDAAMDLGAGELAAIRLVVLPLIAPSIVAAWLTAFTVSFDEFALALFLAGPGDPTFPVYMLGQLRFSRTLPLIISLAVLLLIGTLVLISIAEVVRRRDPTR
jgi:spermidine/putrescine transport system permease protein